jgi:STE24 endopeptidase
VNEDKSTRYHRLKRRSRAASIALSAMLLIVLLASGASTALRDLAAGWAAALPLAAELQPAGVALLYVALLGALHEFVRLPLDFYGSHRLERRYGFAAHGAADWLRARAHATGVGALLAFGGGLLLYEAIHRWPATWWLAGGAALSAAMILLAHLGPILLLPLFHTCTPLRRGSLRARLTALTDRAGAPVLGIYEWRLGDRARRANAALVGLGPARRILLSDTLLAEYSDDEIEVILAHELAHHVNGDIWKAMAQETALILGGFFLADRLLIWLAPLLDLTGPGDVAGLPLLLLSAGGLGLLLMPVANGLSRQHERRADRYALDLTGRPAAFVSAMRRLGAQNLAEDRPSTLVRWLCYTHPPLQQRIAAARAWELSAVHPHVGRRA